jgi:phosphohistidine phosphatase
MKQLYIIRHARAVSALHTPMNDFDRPLSHEGENDANHIGHCLGLLNWMPERMVLSPALRAQSTSEKILHNLKSSLIDVETEPRLYNANYQTLLSILQETPHHYQSVCLIGHNPGLTQLVQALTEMDSIPAMAAGSIYALNVPIEDWHNLNLCNAEYVFYLSPDFLRNP